MKLVNARYGIDINMKENIVDTLVLENKAVMSNIVLTLWNQCNGESGDFVLSDDRELKIDKNMDIIINPFQLDFNNRKITTALYSRLSQIANELVSDKNELNTNAIRILDKIIMSEIYSGIEYNFEFEWNDLFKLYGVRITDAYSSLVENLVEYIKIMSTLCNIKIICFVNIKNYLTDEELLELYSNSCYNKVQLILIESVETAQKENEHICIIDTDMCIINK